MTQIFIISKLLRVPAHTHTGTQEVSENGVISVISVICVIVYTCSHLEAHGAHLLGRATHDDIAAILAGTAGLKAKLGKGTAHHLLAELLCDVGTNDLQRHGHTDELARLIIKRLAEILRHQFQLQVGCLKLLVVPCQPLYLLLREPVAEPLAVETVGLRIDVAVVQRIVVRRLYRPPPRRAASGGCP